MGKPSLAGVRLRLDRAKEHFENIKDTCDRFVRDDPNSAFGLKVELDADRGDARIIAQFPDDLPAELGTLVGEVLYHSRSALDNLAWQLVLAAGSTPGKHTEFPIFKDKAEFDRSARRMMAGMSKPARTTIKDLQPFNVWPEYPAHSTLWKIHELNNIDKHLLPFCTRMWLAFIKGGFRVPGDVGAELVHQAARGPLENNAVLAHVRWDPALMQALPANTQVQMEFAASLDVAMESTEAEFLEEWGEAVSAVPIRGVFETALDYVETTLLPALDSEF